MDRNHFAVWLDAYVEAWRSNDPPMIARLFSGALELPISGLSAGIPSLLRSEPFAIEYGVPDWNVVMPAIDHPPKGYLHQPDRGPGTAHR